MTLFRAHRAVFGEPGKGVHAQRAFGVAAVDLMATLFAALAIALWATAVLPSPSGGGGSAAIFGRVVWRTGIVFAALMILAVCLHWIFGVNTALNVALLGPVSSSSAPAAKRGAPAGMFEN